VAVKEVGIEAEPHGIILDNVTHVKQELFEADLGITKRQ